ncbi:MAG: hypothetical protein N3A58_07150 [Spirochaetes bacterium]|nr:hypothetical protein [Spirochaetota bacterium]
MENLLESIKFKDLKAYDVNEATVNSVCFIGTPFKNPTIQDKIFISNLFFSDMNTFFEFDIKDIIKFEEIDTIVNKDGNSYSLYKIWVRKGAKGIKHESFTVI